MYLRLKDGETIESIPPDVLTDCMQLVKHNSIEGNKLSNVGIVYTYWKNLKKTGDMEVGQVGYHKARDVKHAVVEKRDSEIVKRLNKTKREEYPDLRKQKADRIKELNRLAREKARKQALEQKAIRQRRLAEKEARSYDKMHNPVNMMSNKDFRPGQDADEDDFM